MIVHLVFSKWMIPKCMCCWEAGSVFPVYRRFGIQFWICARVPISSAIDWCHLPFLFSHFLLRKSTAVSVSQCWMVTVCETITSRQWKIDIFKQLSIDLLGKIQPLQQSTFDFDRTNILVCAVFFVNGQCWFQMCIFILQVYDFCSNKSDCVTTFSNPLDFFF